MSEAVSRPLDDEQPKSEAIGTRRVEAKERFENALQLIRRNALAGVVNLDANRRCEPSAADQNAAAGDCVVDRVTREIAQNPV